MDFSNVSNVIRERVKNLMKTKGTQITKLGEILGSKDGESSAQRYLRGKRFLDLSSEVKIPQLLKIADYFERPLSYFLEADAFVLSRSEKHSPSPMRPLQEVEQNMRKMGLDESFIREQIQILKALENDHANSKQ